MKSDKVEMKERACWNDVPLVSLVLQLPHRQR